MGLDIRCYEHIEPVENPTVDELEEGDIIHWYVLGGYESRLDGIDAEYVRPSGKVHSFRAGSYGGYNAWRNLLAEVIRGKTAKELWALPDSHEPFNELINFSDSEGYIGPITSAKLAKDFEDYGEKFASDPRTDEYDREKYMCWCRAFQVAAGKGCVEFC